MLPRGKSCFLADICLLLPQTRPETDISLLNSVLYEGNCRIPSSVRERFDRMLNEAYDYILTDLKDNLPKYLNKIGCTEITRVDGLLFESFFAERRKQIGKARGPSLYYLLESYIENWIVAAVHSIEMGNRIAVTIFLPAVYRELSNKYEELKSPVETIKVVNIEPKKELKAEALRQGISKYEDQDHIASGFECQYTENIWVIFLTNDERDILSHSQRLRDNCAFYVSKPMYAFDHRRELSKRPTPIDYVGQLNHLTKRQEQFFDVLQRTLNVNIVSSEQLGSD